MKMSNLATNVFYRQKNVLLRKCNRNFLEISTDIVSRLDMNFGMLNL